MTGYTDVWNWKGTGSEEEVTVSYLNPYLGYTCIGDISESSKKTHINVFEEYACIKMEYGIHGLFGIHIWDDFGTGADKQVSLWNIESADAVLAKTFISHPNRDEFDNTKFYLLNNKLDSVCNYEDWSDQTGCTK